MEFVCRDPRATVRVGNVVATVAAFRIVPEAAAALLTNYGLPISPANLEAHVPLAPWLEALREIAIVVGDAKLRSVGASMIEKALFPPDFADVPSVLMALDAIYRLNHTGNVGRYVSTRETERWRIDCETPFPRVFERGLVEGICRNEGLRRGKRYEVAYVDGPRHGDRTCTLYVTETAAAPR